MDLWSWPHHPFITISFQLYRNSRIIQRNVLIKYYNIIMDTSLNVFFSSFERQLQQFSVKLISNYFHHKSLFLLIKFYKSPIKITIISLNYLWWICVFQLSFLWWSIKIINKCISKTRVNNIRQIVFNKKINDKSFFVNYWELQLWELHSIETSDHC